MVVTVGEKFKRVDPESVPVITELDELNEYDVASPDTIPANVNVVPAQ